MSIYDSHKPPAGEGGGLYLKLKDGEVVKLRFYSEPAIFESKGDKDDPDNPGRKIETLTTRYGWLVWNQDTQLPQIWQQGVRFFRSLAALAQDEEWGDPTGYDIKITRTGSDTSTVYNVTPSANRAELPAEAIAALNRVNLIEKLEASPFSQRVMWLSDWDEMAAETEQGTHAEEIETVTAHGDAKGIDKARETAENIRVGKKPEPDTVVEDIGDEPMNLDDIPWE